MVRTGTDGAVCVEFGYSSLIRAAIEALSELQSELKRINADDAHLHSKSAASHRVKVHGLAVQWVVDAPLNC